VSFADWISEPVNWVFLVIGLAVLVSAFRVVTSKNVVHAALFLVGALGGSAGLFLLLSAEFVAWVLVLVYIGAVIVLFLFGIMITRAPMGSDISLDHRRKAPAVLVSAGLFAVLAWATVSAFQLTTIAAAGEVVPTDLLGDALLGRFVIPFEVVSFLLLAALIGGITVARRDLTPLEEEERRLA
jgi:NADH-quinone oxidoreductase subunit J